MHTIKICTGLSCSNNFAPDLLDKAEKMLGIKPGETSEDGNFRLEKVGCMGNCANAPNVFFGSSDSPLSMIMIDGNIEENVLPHKLEKKIQALL